MAVVAEYQVKILDHDGNLVAVLDRWNTLEYELLHNDIGNHTITLDLNDVKVTFFQLDYFVQVWRKPSGRDWYLDYDGFHRTPQQTISENNLELFTSYGRHINDVLRRRTILYFAGTDYTNKSGPVDDVMKAYVEENAGATATTNPDRMRNILTPIYVAANEGLGPNWEGQRSFKKLIDVLQELGKWSTYRFYIDRDVDEEFGPDPNALVFRTFEKRQELRQGFSAIPVVFSPQLGNMRTPSHTVSRVDEIQAVVALGQGEGEDRIFLEELGENVADSPYNDIEAAEDARQEELTAGLEVAALTVLAENGPQEALEFEVVQIPSCLYGVHYGVSDYVSGNFLGVTKDYRITAVTVHVADGQETITCRFQVVKHVFNLAPGDISSGYNSDNPLADIIKNLSFRLRDLELREPLAGLTLPQFTVPIFDSTGVTPGDILSWDGNSIQLVNGRTQNIGQTLILPKDFYLGASSATLGVWPGTNVPGVNAVILPDGGVEEIYASIPIGPSFANTFSFLDIEADVAAQDNGSGTAVLQLWYAFVTEGQPVDPSAWIGPFGGTVQADGNYKRTPAAGMDSSTVPYFTMLHVKLARGTSGFTDPITGGIYVFGLRVWGVYY